MIDTDKYEGHTSDWKWIDTDEQGDFHLYGFHQRICHHTPDAKLAQDAPLLLEEVKRLREELDKRLDEINRADERVDELLAEVKVLDVRLRSKGEYNAVVIATGNAGRGSIMVDVIFDDGDEYYGILDKVTE